MSGHIELPDGALDKVVAALRASSHPELAAGELSLLGAGMDSLALRLDHDGETYVLRCPFGPDGAEGIAREAAVLPELAATLTLPIPRFLLTAPNPLGPGQFCLYPAVPGESLSEAEWLRRGLPDSAVIVGQIAEFLTQSHAFPVSRAEQLGVEIRDMRTDFTEDLDLVRDRVLPLLAPASARELERSWTNYLGDDRNFDYRPTLTHADISPDHLLVTGDRISGVIDFGDLTIGDPDYDLVYLWTDLGPDFVAKVRRHRGLPLDDRLSAKLGFWAKADMTIDVLHGLENAMPEFTEQSLQNLAEVLERS